jgi:uncharacterized damage-inducible protein DinB
VIGPIPLAPDPDRAAGERQTLVEFLDYFRSVLLRKASGLTNAQLSTRLAPSTLTIGGLLKHMAGVEDHWFTHTWLGAAYPEPWATADDGTNPDWDFDSAAGDTPEQLHELFEAALARSRAAIDGADDLDRLAALESRLGATSLRWILVHMIEEYARHIGHADLIRESLDGATDD